jgi:hypothetical protein
MSKIHLPPTADHGGSVITTCVSSTGGDSLEIDVDDPGYFVHTPDGYFNPELPSGKLDKQSLILYPTVSAGMAYLAYFDIPTKDLYLVVITIQVGPCNSDSEVQKPK